MTTTVRALCLCALIASTTASAAGSVYAVLPTQGAGATAEAGLVAQTMRLALQEQSLAQVPAARVESATLANTVACTQSVVACGRLVGQATSATHVLLSELWDQAGTFELRVALLDVRVDTPPVWSTFRTTASAEIGPLAKKAALGLVSPDSLAGGLSVQGPRGCEIVVDGVVADQTPLLKPVRLPAGPHELEIRAAGLTSHRQTVQIESGQTAEVQVCDKAGAVVAGPEACAVAGPQPLPVLGIAGGAAVGTGVVVGVAAGVFVLAAATAWGDYVADPNDADEEKVRSNQSLAVATGAVAGALVLTGAGLLVAELILGGQP